MIVVKIGEAYVATDVDRFKNVLVGKVRTEPANLSRSPSIGYFKNTGRYHYKSEAFLRREGGGGGIGTL